MVLKCRQATAEEVLTEEELGSEHMGTHRQDSSRRKTMLPLSFTDIYSVNISYWSSMCKLLGYGTGANENG